LCRKVVGWATGNAFISTCNCEPLSCARRVAKLENPDHRDVFASGKVVFCRADFLGGIHLVIHACHAFRERRVHEVACTNAGLVEADVFEGLIAAGYTLEHTASVRVVNAARARTELNVVYNVVLETTGYALHSISLLDSVCAL
jgi:hypothetical protein